MLKFNKNEEVFSQTPLHDKIKTIKSNEINSSCMKRNSEYTHPHKVYKY